VSPTLLRELSRLYEAEARELPKAAISEKARLRSIARALSDRAREALSFLNMLRSKWPVTAAQKETPRTR
jgi:hypothetical protein